MQSVGSAPATDPHVKLSPTPHQKMFRSRLRAVSLQVVDWIPLLLGPMLTDARRLSGVETPFGLQTGNSLAADPGFLHTSNSAGSLADVWSDNGEGEFGLAERVYQHS